MKVHMELESYVIASDLGFAPSLLTNYRCNDILVTGESVVATIVKRGWFYAKRNHNIPWFV